ncbi:MAG: hypothetical protein PWQ82_1526 [Thermosediminibacterales bacterium]|nr:hypothetical protein [Thermosediminibacterales bacterium]
MLFEAEVIAELLQGAIDMHVHSSPSLFERSVDDLELVKSAREAGMKAVVIKSHDGNSAGRANIAQKAVGEGRCYAFGGLVLNSYCGGLNPDAVEAAIKIGAKIIWMPTVSSQNHINVYGATDYTRKSQNKHLNNESGIIILNKFGELLPEVEKILEIIGENDVCLATGHLSNLEIKVLCEKALKKGLKKILITHPDFETNRMSLPEQKYYAEKGIYLEKTLLSLSPQWNGIEPNELVRGIEYLGPESCVITTDYGQKDNIVPIEGMKQFLKILLDNDMKAEHIEEMLKKNPGRLLNIS